MKTEIKHHNIQTPAHAPAAADLAAWLRSRGLQCRRELIRPGGAEVWMITIMNKQPNHHRRCACGQPAFKIVANGGVCRRCDEIEQRRLTVEKADNRRPDHSGEVIEPYRVHHPKLK